MCHEYIHYKLKIEIVNWKIYCVQLGRMDKTNGDGSDDSNRFVYNVNLPNLQEMASYRIALSLWRGYLPVGKYSTTLQLENHPGKQLTKIFSLKDDYRKEYIGLLDLLNVPQSIKRMLKKACKRIEYEMRLWVQKLYNIILSRDVFVCDPNWCVWLPNGTIDHEQSAVKMLSSVGSEFSAEKRFEVLCEFCMEDELLTFPMDSLPENYITGEDVRDDDLIKYWYYYAKKEVPKIPRLSHDSSSLCAKIFLDYVRPGTYPNWRTVEYFWNRLDTDEQVSVANTLFDNYDSILSSSIHERLLGMMSWDQQRRLLIQNHIEVILKFIQYSDSLKPAYWAWTHSQHLLSDEDFDTVIVSLLNCKLDIEEWMSWLCDIWDSASDQYKIHGVKDLEDELVTRFDVDCHPSRSAFKFLCRILSLLSADARKEIFVKIARRLGARFIDFRSFDELSNLCFSNADDRSKFKKTIIEIEKFYCMELIQEGNLDDLDAILEFYLVTSNDIRAFKLELLKCEEFYMYEFVYEPKKWNALCKFIDKLYPENVSLALQTRKQLLSSCTFDASHFEGDTPYDVTQLFNIVESEFEEEEIDALKRNWFNSFRSVFKNKQNDFWCEIYFDEMYFCKFVKWCVGNSDGAMLGYDCGAFVDEVFDSFFVSLDDDYNKMGRFKELLLSKLSVCLNGLFMNDEEVKKYKLARMTSVNDLKFFQSVLNRNDELRLQILLDWFFDGDDSSIREFRSKKLRVE